MLRDDIAVDASLPLDVDVRGTRFQSRPAIVAATERGDEVDLVRDYDNLVDRNAIFVRRSGEDLGYVPRFVAQALAPEIDAGETFTARVTDVDAAELNVSIRIDRGAAGF